MTKIVAYDFMKRLTLLNTLTMFHINLSYEMYLSILVTSLNVKLIEEL